MVQGAHIIVYIHMCTAEEGVLRGWCWWSQVILMDHVDWLGQKDIDTLCQALKKQVKVRPTPQQHNGN